MECISYTLMSDIFPFSFYDGGGGEGDAHTEVRGQSVGVGCPTMQVRGMEFKQPALAAGGPSPLSHLTEA